MALSAECFLQISPRLDGSHSIDIREVSLVNDRDKGIWIQGCTCRRKFAVCLDK